MKVSIVEQDHIQFGDGQQRRTSGIHLSGVIRAIAVRMGYLHPDSGRTFDLQARTRMCLGIAWEDWLAKRIPGMQYHFGELVEDNIIMTPDGASFMPDLAGLEKPRLHEFKLTWKSQARSRDWSKEWMWLAQMKAYCRALGVNECWLHVYWVNGDYSASWSTGPCYEVYSFEFDQQELDLNWKLILENVDKAEAESYDD